MAILNDSNPFNKKAKAEELEALLDKYIPGVEVMRTKLKKYDKTYKELTAENAELEKKLSSASKESVRKKLEISQKLNELDELRRTVDAIPDEVIREYTARKYVHHGRMNQEVLVEEAWLKYYNQVLFEKGVITERERNLMINMIDARTTKSLSR